MSVHSETPTPAQVSGETEKNVDSIPSGIPGEERFNIEEPGKVGRNSGLSSDLRNISYVILFIAAVFVVNALETGSYRTPWPVAILVTFAGLGLLFYSLVVDRSGKG